MKKSFLLTAIVAAAAASQGCSQKGSSSGATVPQFNKNSVVSNELLVRGDKEQIAKDLDRIGIDGDHRHIRNMFENQAPDEHIYSVQYKSDADLKDVMEAVAEHAESVEPNRILQTQTNLNRLEWPNDKYFAKQYALNNVGQSAPFSIPGERGADMAILDAWKKTQGSPDVVVAVIDSGCDYTHPDLKHGLKVNEKEAPANGGVAGVDDDANGYVDDVYGFNFVSADLTQPFYGVSGGPDPMDDNSHGTHVSGAIVAEANNGIGVAGIAPGARIICAKVGNAQGMISTKDAARGIRYARIRGANIMTNSWGGAGSYDSSILNGEIHEAEKAGILFVVAAGNDGKNIDVSKTYPASLKADGKREGKFKNVLVVGASDNQDNPAYFSNYGVESVDVFAPGVMILSTVPNTSGSETGTYGVMSGTSMATPYVTAVAALLMSYNPSLKGHPEDVINLIDQTADMKESLVGKAISNGRINANRALEQARNSQIKPLAWQMQSYNLSQRGYNKELVDIRHEINIPGAKSIKVHFNFIDIEEPYDSLYIYDKNYRLVSRVENTDTTEFWSSVIPGDTAYVRFVNAKVQRVMFNPIIMSSESDCASRGASNITRLSNDKFNCDVDSDDSSGGGSKPFFSFNSEGFTIDQVAFVAADNDSPTQSVTKN